jgi:hypothetical protein
MEEANTDFGRMISETISLELRRGRRTVSTAANGGTFMPGNLHYLDVVRGKFSFSHPEMQDMTLVPGQGILIAPGTRYSICVDGDPGEIRYVHIDFSVFGSVALGSVCRYSPLVSKELTGPIGDCIEKIYAITGSKGPRSLEEIVYPKQVKAALMHLLLRHFDDTESVMEVLCAYRVLAPVFEFIKVNLDRPDKT